MRNKGVMFGSRGFTLVELLVVISIIAMLMAILLPGLSAARRAAKNVKDMMNLRQWGTMLTMFAQDNDGKLMVGWNGGDSFNGHITLESSPANYDLVLNASDGPHRGSPRLVRQGGRQGGENPAVNGNLDGLHRL